MRRAIRILGIGGMVVGLATGALAQEKIRYISNRTYTDAAGIG